jgi:hypothetical protein
MPSVNLAPGPAAAPFPIIIEPSPSLADLLPAADLTSA